MAKITFEDKVALNPQPSIDNVNKCTSGDMNEIKTCVNDNCTYSTNEICIGEWIDGKPLYRKVIDVGNLPNNTSKNIQVGVSNISCKHLYGTAVGTGVGTAYLGYTLTLPLVHTNTLANGISIRYDGSNGASQITIVSGADYSGYTGHVVMEYTKTTD